MSAPQHIGDLILPWSLGHFDTCTVEPSSLVKGGVDQRGVTRSAGGVHGHPTGRTFV